MRRTGQLRLAGAAGSLSGPVEAPSRALQVKVLESRLSNFAASTVYSLTTLLDLRDLSTGTHGTRLAEWAVQVGELAGLDGDELRDLEIASLLHDIGKVGLPDAILDKPGTLSKEEFEEIKKHPDFGWSILRLLPGFDRVSMMVLHHHERVDGKGYPAGLVADQIPLGARIVAVVDAFDAMTSDRPYRRGLPLEEALRRLQAASGTQFDGQIVDLFFLVVQRDCAASKVGAAPAA